MFAVWSVGRDHPAMRVGDRERRRVERRVRDGYLRGELSADTFEARLAAVLGARGAAELDALAWDLPRPLDRLRTWVRAQVRGDGPGRPVLVMPDAVEGAVLWLGRGSACEIRFMESSVSRRHAELRRVREGWLVVDRGSTNGTWVNGRRVARAHVGDGDELQLGDARVVLRA